MSQIRAILQQRRGTTKKSSNIFLTSIHCTFNLNHNIPFVINSSCGFILSIVPVHYPLPQIRKIKKMLTPLSPAIITYKSTTTTKSDVKYWY